MEDDAADATWSKGTWFRGAAKRARSFSYRVEGGDGRSMPWPEVEVVEPPAVESLSVRLVPPAYTGWPADRNPRGTSALVGTEVRIAGRPRRRWRLPATLCLEGAGKIPAWIGSDGYSLHASVTAATPFVVEKSGAYWFELTDREGLHGGADDRWEIRPIADAPAVGAHRAALSQSVRHGGGRRTDSRGGQRRPCHPRRRAGVPPRRVGAGDTVCRFLRPKQRRDRPQDLVGNHRKVDYRWDPPARSASRARK